MIGVMVHGQNCLRGESSSLHGFQYRRRIAGVNNADIAADPGVND